MPKIPIKIKKSDSADEKVAEEMKVDLRNELEPEQKQPRSTGLLLSVFLLLVTLGLAIGWFFSAQQKMAFADLVPEQAVVFGLINQQELYPQAAPFKQFLSESNFYGQAAVNKLNDYFNQSQLSFNQDIQPLFKEQLAFILLPTNSETSFPFILLFEKESSMAQLSQILDKIEPKLKQDYNFSSQIYRQIKITILKHLFSTNSYLYSQIGDYFIISNSQASLEKIIDLIIDK